jgi:hypothetical protein
MKNILKNLLPATIIAIAIFAGLSFKNSTSQATEKYLIEKQNAIEFIDRILQVHQNKEISEFNSEFAKSFDIESYCEKLLNSHKNTLKESKKFYHCLVKLKTLH